MSGDPKEVINEILIEKEVRDFYSFIMTFIPELKACVGFDQNHPHHHLDVWEHTLLALDNLDSDDLETNMALLLHDIGKPFCYQDEEVRHFKGHPIVSAKMAKSLLTRLGYNNDFISNVCYIIKEHDNPLDPNNMSELDYKILDLQFADAKAHHPDKVLKKVKKLESIKKEIENK